MMILKSLGFCGWKTNESSSSKREYKTVIEELCHQFCMEDIRKATNNLDKKLLLVEATNNFWLYKGCVEYNGTSDYTIAIKRGNPTKKKNEEDSTRSYMVKEIEVLCQLRHPNIISLIGFCDNENEIIAVYEYMANGSLDDYLTNRNNQPLSWKKRLEICIGVARALHYLHSGVKRVIIHRLINSSYILGVLDNNMMPKLAYFGHSLQGPLSTSKPKPIIDVLQGTIGYVSPEIFSCGIYTDKCDVYSFGNVLLDVIFGRKDKDLLVKKVNMFASLHFGKSTIEFREHLPLRGFWLWVRELLCNRIPMEELVDSDLNGKISPECWDAVTSIAQRCIEYEADERPTMGEVELLLERAFSLQQQADDITNTNAAHYTLSSTTYIHGRPSICIDANNTEDILSHQFSRADLALMTGNFNETKIIGKGSFGELYQGRVRLKGLTDNYYYLIAIKKMHWPSICYSEMQFKFREEIEKICVLRHPNLVSLLGFCNDDGDAVAAAAADDDDYNDDDAKILVSEFIQNGSLLYNLHESHRNKKALTWKKRLQICIGVTQGLHYLHTASIFHRNIKLTNILLDRAMVPKLSDFGFPWSNPIHAGLTQGVMLLLNGLKAMTSQISVMFTLLV
ncbi:LOW QUALITY PROTEIN: probable serine/threonine-protein kinase PBL11 [Arachis hypogaea]|uniref:LOW QUALITY PROTEIN: probable serine/threonine-protein kinase PBL11 n=1 Tax=Arachis hypogaea TaxID=3818 RepID=UPI003B222A09